MVYSTASDDRINPRSVHLGFYGGSSIWSFPNGKDCVIAFTNNSSLAAFCRVYYKNVIVEFGDDLVVQVYQRDSESIVQFPQVTRTGNPTQYLYKGRLKGVHDFWDSLRTAHYELIINNNNLCNASIGQASVSAVIGALISGKSKYPVQLPVNPESDEGLKEWPIS
jgi:hypothetical protein